MYRNLPKFYEIAVLSQLTHTHMRSPIIKSAQSKLCDYKIKLRDYVTASHGMIYVHLLVTLQYKVYIGGDCTGGTLILKCN